MNLETISKKHLNELERLITDLLVTLRKAKLQDDPLVLSLTSLEKRLEEARREKFDAVNTEFHTY